MDECKRLNDEILNHYNDWIKPPKPRTLYALRNGGSTIGGPKYEQMLRELRDECVKIDGDGFVNIQEEHLSRFHPQIQSKYQQLRNLLSATGTATATSPVLKLNSDERMPLKAFLKEYIRRGVIDRSKLCEQIRLQPIYENDPWIADWREKGFEDLTWATVQNHERPRAAFSTMISKLFSEIRTTKK